MIRTTALAGLMLIASSTSGEVSVTPHWINSDLNNRDLTLAPDGRMMMSTIMSPANQFAAIVVSTKRRKHWSKPKIAPFSGIFSDIEPMFTPDGSRLWFASKRPKPDRDGDDWDLWYVDRNGDRWSEPVNPGAPINTPGNEFYPSVASNGNVYFTAERESGQGREDIFRAVWDGQNFSAVDSVGAGVNTAGFEFNAFVSPDETYLIFSSQRGREDEIGGGDLYISYRAEGEFGQATILPQMVNSTALDYCPFVHDGVLYFSSRRFADAAPFESFRALEQALRDEGNGLGDIYSVSFDLLPN